MAIYLPIDVPLPIRASRSDIDAFRWSNGGVGVRLLGTDGSGRMLDIDFARSSIVRLLDEMALSTEEAHDEKIGLVAEHCF